MSINVRHHDLSFHRLDRESMTGLLQSRLGKLERWVETQDYEGYEPFDGMSSWLSAFTFRNGFMERLLIQLVRQSPVNLRPLLGVMPHASTKGRGYMALGYLKNYGFSGEERYKIRAERSLEWLMENRSPNVREYGWGNHFDFSSRGGRLPKHEPTIVWNSLIGQAFLDGYELLQERRYLEVAESVCRWILRLPREKTSAGSCLSYVAYQQNSVHNSNMLGAAMLARTARFTGDRKALKVAKEAMEFSCSRQLGHGAWYYGVHPNTHWIDNFHTGYNLDSLRSYIETTGDPDYAGKSPARIRILQADFFRGEREAEILSQPRLPDRHPVRGPGDRYLDGFFRRRRNVPGAGGESRKVDDGKHAGRLGVLLLQGSAPHEGENPDDALGAGYHV